MSFQSDLILASPDDATEICTAANPTKEWDGFSFQGLDNIKLATLLSLVSSQSASVGQERWLAEIPAVVAGTDGTMLFAISATALQILTKIAAIDEDQFEELVNRWAATDEFDGWEVDEVNELLRDIGDLAETATLERKSMFLRMSP